jgi:hypothetical protein
MKSFAKSKKIKLKSVAKLHAELWCLKSEYIRRTEDKCYTCDAIHEWKLDHAGHFEHGQSLDFIDNNIHRQCVRCNHRLSGNLGVYAIRLDKQFGVGTAERLHNEKYKLHKYSRSWYEEQILEYKLKLEDLDATL